MLDGLAIKATNTWLGYKKSKAMTYAMPALFKNNKHFLGKLRYSKNTTAVLTKVIFNDLQALKTRINGHDEYLETLD